jgi:acyl-coenzyme A thioesterase PaaI-like protein
MSDRAEIPPGYDYEASTSAFINHVGRLYTKRVMADDGSEREFWAALRIEQHHVNTWNLCHGAVMSLMAEIGTGGPGWTPDAPPAVVIELNTHFIAAPRLGDLLEVRGMLTKRTRSLIFSSARGEVAGRPMFSATSIQKVIGA